MTRDAARVLLVDDTTEIRTLLRIALELTTGFEVIGEAGDGAEGVRLAAELRPDAVVLDLSMPTMDGLEALRRIKALSPAPRVVVFSGVEPALVAGEVERVGGDAYVPKGSSIHEVVATLQRLTSASAGAVKDRPVIVGARPRWLADHLLGSESFDHRLRAGRLACVLYVAAALAVLATVAVLPAPAHRAAVTWTAVVALVTAALIWFVPWDRMGQWWTMAPVGAAYLLLGVGIGRLGAALPYYLPFYILSFLYVGLTQRPGVALLAGPAAAASMLFGLTLVDGRQAAPVLAAITTASGVLIGEILSQLVGRYQRSTTALEAVLVELGDMTSARDVGGAVDVIAGLSQRLLGADSIWVFLEDEDGSGLVSRAGRGLFASATIRLDADAASGVVAAMQMGRSVFAPVAESSPLVEQSLVRRFGVRSAYFMPIQDQLGVIGAVAAVWRRGHRLPDRLADQVLTLVARESATTIRRLWLTERLRHDADTDPLTGLFNRRYLDDRLQQVTAGTAVVMIDLDHFKRLNDRLGHDQGDRELKTFAAALQSVLRPRDLAARYGGEEFTVVLPGADASGACAVLERLREQWSSVGRTTFSAGVAVHHTTRTGHATVERADAALYRAKAAGRDRVVLDAEPESCELQPGKARTPASAS